MIRMRHKSTQLVFDYFNLVRNGESAPLRADIAPQALKTVLPDVFMLETGPFGGLRFRLAGTRVCAILGQEARGTDLLSYFASPQRHKMKLASESVLANRVPLVCAVNGFATDVEPQAYEMLLLPLRSRADTCDRLLGSIVAVDCLPRFGDPGRILEAGRLSFVHDQTRPRVLEPLVNVAISNPESASFASRMRHLKLLQGGRRD
jgi:hypothetical protein